MKPLRVLLLLAALMSGALAQEPASDDESTDDPGFTPAPTMDPDELEIPDGVKAEPPEAEYALLDGRVVRVFAELGDQRAVKLPTGQMSIVDRSATGPSEGPFKPASREEIVASLEADGISGYKIEPAGYYLFAYDCSEAYYLHTRSILESMLRGVVKQLAEWGLDPQRPEQPLVIVITPNRAAFDKIERMPDGVAAYYNAISNRVVLYEDDRLFDAAPEYALKQGAYIVAHEAIHQLLHNTGIQQRLSGWPQWVSEGLPEYFCPMKVNSRLARTDGDQLPVRTVRWTEAGMVNDIRMHDLLRTRPEGGRLIRDVVAGASLTAHGYSVAWGLTHYLAERRASQLKEYLADLKQTPALAVVGTKPDHAPDPLFVKHFGDDYASVERRVQHHLTSRPMQQAYLDPFVNQTHYIVSITFKKVRTYYTTAAITLSPAAAREWRDKQKSALDDRNIDAHVVTKECKTAREARYQLAKILN